MYGQVGSTEDTGMQQHHTNSTATTIDPCTEQVHALISEVADRHQRYIAEQVDDGEVRTFAEQSAEQALVSLMGVLANRLGLSPEQLGQLYDNMCAELS